MAGPDPAFNTFASERASIRGIEEAERGLFAHHIAAADSANCARSQDGVHFNARNHAYRCTYLGVSVPRPRYSTAFIMNKAAARFERILDPNNNWLVWDNLAEEPSSLTGDPLIGLTEPEAKAALAVLAILIETAACPAATGAPNLQTGASAPIAVAKRKL